MVAQVQSGETPSGKIIIMSSIHEQLPVKGSVPYNMAKAALEALTQVGPRNIRSQYSVDPLWLWTAPQASILPVQSDWKTLLICHRTLHPHWRQTVLM